ncbi:MAG: hypothetical protein MUO58_16565 [Anaerolineales bacterium]|nr:hypothetical protein [Anaerolineales bacterium]
MLRTERISIEKIVDPSEVRVGAECVVPAFTGHKRADGVVRLFAGVPGDHRRERRARADGCLHGYCHPRWSNIVFAVQAYYRAETPVVPDKDLIMRAPLRELADQVGVPSRIGGPL